MNEFCFTSLFYKSVGVLHPYAIEMSAVDDCISSNTVEKKPKLDTLTPNSLITGASNYCRSLPLMPSQELLRKVQAAKRKRERQWEQNDLKKKKAEEEKQEAAKTLEMMRAAVAPPRE